VAERLKVQPLISLGHADRCTRVNKLSEETWYTVHERGWGFQEPQPLSRQVGG
jgi:hypothetical protein